jgi:hypothetical protein
LKDIGKVNKFLYFYSKLFDKLAKTGMTGVFLRNETAAVNNAIEEADYTAFGQIRERELMSSFKDKTEFIDKLSHKEHIYIKDIL